MNVIPLCKYLPQSPSLYGIKSKLIYLAFKPFKNLFLKRQTNKQTNKTPLWSSCRGAAETNPTRNNEVAGSTLPSLSG